MMQLEAVRRCGLSQSAASSHNSSGERNHGNFEYVASILKNKTKHWLDEK